MPTLLEMLSVKRDTYVRALRGNKLTYEQRISLNEKLDAVVDELERLTPCDYCGRMLACCECPF